MAVYQRTAPRLRAYLRRVSGEAALADDILQEAFIRLLRAGRPGASKGETTAFLYRAATNLVHDHWRRQKRERKALGGLDAAPAASGPLSLGPDVGRIFDHLSPRDRALLWLAHVEEWSHAEIAAALGLKSISVRVMLFRARAELARRLRRERLQPTECFHASP